MRKALPVQKVHYAMLEPCLGDIATGGDDEILVYFPPKDRREHEDFAPLFDLLGHSRLGLMPKPERPHELFQSRTLLDLGLGRHEMRLDVS